MKTIIAIMLLAPCMALGQATQYTPQLPPPKGTPAPTPAVVSAPPSPAASPTKSFKKGEITLANGTIVKGEISKVVPETVEIKTETGSVELPISEIDSDYCLQMIPNSARAHAIDVSNQFQKSVADEADGIDRILTAIEKNEKSPTPQPGPQASATPAVKDGLNIVEFNAKETESGETYMHAGWKVSLFNNSDSDITDLTVTFTFLDREHIELDHDVKYNVDVPARKRIIVTGNMILKKVIWAKVDSLDATAQ